jgi:hypothetical protein
MPTKCYPFVTVLYFFRYFSTRIENFITKSTFCDKIKASGFHISFERPEIGAGQRRSLKDSIYVKRIRALRITIMNSQQSKFKGVYFNATKQDACCRSLCCQRSVFK